MPTTLSRRRRRSRLRPLPARRPLGPSPACPGPLAEPGTPTPKPTPPVPSGDPIDIPGDPADPFEARRQVVRDQVALVADGYATGLVVTGRGGHGKTYLVTEELAVRGVDFLRHGGHMTPKALFEALAAAPAAVHVLDDLELLVRSPAAAGVLREATHSGLPPGPHGRVPRPIRWATHGRSRTVEFVGGLILVGNRPLPDTPEFAAFKTRIPCVDLSLSDAELETLIRGIASQGFRHGDESLTPGQALEAAAFVLGESARAGRPPDVRLFERTCLSRLAWEAGRIGTHWHDLARSAIREVPVARDRRPAGRSRQVEHYERLLEVALRLQAVTDRGERERSWREATGLSVDRYYAVLRRHRDTAR